MDIGRVISSSLFSAAIGIAFVVVALIIPLLYLVLDESTASYIPMAILAYSIIMFPVFFGLFFWNGMQAVSKSNLDVVGAGMSSALAYFICAAAHLVLNTVMTLVVLTKGNLNISVTTPESIISTSLIDNLSGNSGIVITFLFGVGILFMGLIVNFVVGGLGAIFVLERR